MRTMRLTAGGYLKIAVVLNLGIVACLTDGGDPVTPGGAGSGNGGTGGAVAGTGGSVAGTGGSVAGTGGSVAGTGGAVGGTGGSVAGTGGISGSTGAGTGGVAGSSGSGGVAAGAGAGAGGSGAGTAGMSGSGGAGMGGMGGMSGSGAAGASGVAGMTGGAGTGGGGSGECIKGQTKGDQVVMIGESFIAATHQITQQVETRAKAAGALPQSERYIDNSVSGTTLANNQIPSQYTKAVQSSGDIKYVLMDGGGNDCLINNNGNAALSAATSLFETMAENGTEKVVYFFYPDPIGANFSSLKTCLDALRPQMKAICDGLTTPKCYWIDLRETWNGHSEYTADGIHPTTAGSVATGDAIWESMVENCVAQ